MDECRAIPVGVDPFEIDNELARVMLCVRKNLGTEQGDNMVANDVEVRNVVEVCIVDTEMTVEPVDFVGDEGWWDESLWILVRSRTG